ncbi:MAG TPA: NUDIX hydrolase N-terminal domain-containing protein [Stackebrandtia sp.]|uniref:NUDIX hydrolase N-terminal domain-containing protein n=1 Tax=Stackebrandtia sp. TaxID=2023065 RepID=UPI002D5D900B|nr:NUDIX hydrolase N-terminal domain-containing protein [Stackebrandtia sp.]HZE41115.1 NUDIX hydrolase N-terminal domain-containing protein [Stackebrandtia sp.]
MTSVGSRERRVAAIADELRADAANGLFYDAAPADAARFTRLRRLAAELLAEVDSRDADQITSVFDTDRGLRTPWLGVALVLNDQRRGIMLAADAGDGRPGIPHAFVDESLPPETAVQRLAETLIPDAQVLPVPHGVCDTISAGLPMVHTYFLTYVVDVTFVAPEDIAVPLVPQTEADESDVDPLTAYLIAGADRTVIDAPLALPASTRDILSEVRELAIEGRPDTDDPYDIARYQRITETMDALLAGVPNEAPYVEHHFGPLDVRTPVTSAEALITDPDGRILLLRRHDTGEWAMPGGACEVGESSAGSAVREVQEELVLDIEIDGLAGVFDNRSINAPKPGTWVAFVYIAHQSNPSDQPENTAEALESAWFRPEDIKALNTFNGHDVKIERALTILNG